VSQDRVFKIAILGAGLTGLSLGQDLLRKHSKEEILILEKSKGSGGRMATRRSEECTYDHGAQYLKRSEVSQRWIEKGENSHVLKDFPASGRNAVCGITGMTQLAKFLAQDLDVQFNQKLITLKKENNFWNLTTDQGSLISAQQVVLTAPLPQSLEILKNSQISFNSGLAKIEYAKALVLLLELDFSFPDDFTFKENVGGGIFSICAQYKKGISRKPCWTLVMDEAWSQKYFALEDSQILSLAQEAVARQFPELKIKSVQLKKWRYSHPLTSWNSLFEAPAEGLYLGGDAFGGPSLNGALRSSQALAHQLGV
jgi:predicted NAD/FAD-dependent oxidoreductase